MYHHIKRDERVALGALLREGLNQSEIAQRLGVHRSTVNRELKRNTKESGSYHAAHAQVRARDRRRHAKKDSRLLENDTSLVDLVEALLDPLVSPKCIAHLLGIHHQSIYAWIQRSHPNLKECLPYQGRKRRRYGGKREEKQGWTRNVRSIEEREEAYLNWEGDTVRGKGRARLLTHVERRSLYTRVDRIPSGTADAVHATLKADPLPGTITYDRGSEFALWEMIGRDTPATIYFAQPHHPCSAARTRTAMATCGGHTRNGLTLLHSQTEILRRPWT